MSSNKVCNICKTPLIIGKFAYNQVVCWDCFEKRVRSIADAANIPEDRDIILHLLYVARESHRRRWNEND